MKHVYRADTLLVSKEKGGGFSLECIPNGGVQVVGSRIGKVAPVGDFDFADGPVTNLGSGVLMPGLINAHCHLELGFLQGKLASNLSFPTWVDQLQQSFSSLQEGEIEKGIQEGIQEALHSGTTTMVDVGNTGKALKALSCSSLREYAYWEVLGLDLKVGIGRLEKYLKQNSEDLEDSGGWGISAHAPFSCSPDLLQRVVEESNCKPTMPFTMHLGESVEEQELFTERRGALYDFCLNRCSQVPGLKGKNGWKNAFEYVLEKGFAPQESLMVHCNTIDREALKEFYQKKISIVHCPRSHDFLNHPPFPYELCQEMEVNVCLGTDSLASNFSLNMFHEMAYFKSKNPDIAYEEILGMATLNGAKALGRSQELGSLKEGFFADCIYVESSQKREKKSPLEKETFLENLICNSPSVQWSMIHGKEVPL